MTLTAERWLEIPEPPSLENHLGNTAVIKAPCAVGGALLGKTLAARTRGGG